MSEEREEFLPAMQKSFEDPQFTADLLQCGYVFNPVTIFDAFADAFAEPIDPVPAVPEGAYGRYENLTDEDRKFLKACGIQPRWILSGRLDYRRCYGRIRSAYTT